MQQLCMQQKGFLSQRRRHTGAAQAVPGSIRASIVNPHAHLVPGPTYSAAGRSFMPDNYDKTLKPEQIDELVAYLATLR